ncbi:hypothetical protein [Pseudomonas japonica]|uniref:hypothetical protein n=1 Tax=Pseudomonas japonica TaxID=256466 RepID=UPI003A87DA8B
MEKVGAYTERTTADGEWQGGDVQSGLRATPMLAEYFNMQQRELVAVVKGAGLQLSKADEGQLLKAIKILADQNIEFGKIINLPDSIEGYGIKNALPNSNPLPGGDLDLHGAGYVFISSRFGSSVCQNVYWSGSDWVKHDVMKAAVAITAQDGRAYIRTWPAGSLFHDTALVLDASMEATASDLDAGVTPSKWVSAAGLANYFGRKIKSASETVAGICRFATLSEVVAGTSGFMAVAPAYLTAGFVANFNPGVGYIKLPQWLGGFMMQWSYSDESSSQTDYRYFPVPFTSMFGAWMQLSSETVNGFAGSYGTIIQLVDNNRYLWTAGGTFGGGGRGWVLALGR